MRGSSGTHRESFRNVGKRKVPGRQGARKTLLVTKKSVRKAMVADEGRWEASTGKHKPERG